MNNFAFSSSEELKQYFRIRVKTLHPDRGGNPEEYLKFLEWYKKALGELQKKESVSILKQYIPKGNSFYKMQEFTIREVALAETVELTLPLREITCPDCKGCGQDLKGAKETCHNCQGKGVLTLLKGNQSLTFPCSFCNGKGVIFKESCSRCMGKGKIKEEERVKVKLPPGLREGDILFIPGSLYNAKWDFYLEVVLKKHPNLTLEKDKLLYELKLPFYEILIKETIAIDTLEGREEIPSRLFTTGGSVVLRGRGPFVKENDSIKRGDLVISLKPVFPEKISAKAKSYLEKAIKYMEGFKNEDPRF
ncbi:molecular chaperone DnaJ [Caldimicrobium thiodismutans]|uniref:Molecular chaperone DnaJ n=1 Tax=Caldimicrobium thiodismutans TaxID=1653476 RepID=A0A0U4N146_9BACT|nr:DnaJ C-terminal domain-containing protein [Caldimicrobium thiodismutans]BAU22950.1 molecular chaperone DnaJ [Caldimicrobium thiodismutans]